MSAAKAVVRCEQLCGAGPAGHARGVALKYSVSLAGFDRQHARVHALILKAKEMPGGAGGLVREAAQVRANLAQAMAEVGRLKVTGHLPGSQRLGEWQHMADGHARRLQELEEEIATLPEEARIEPAAVVLAATEQLEAARASKNVKGIGAAAEVLKEARRLHAAAIAERAKLQSQVNDATLAAMASLAAALEEAFDALAEKMARLTSEPHIEAAPELLDHAAVAAIWREATAIGEAESLIGFTAPDLFGLLVRVPRGLWDSVASSVGVFVPRGLRVKVRAA